MTDIKVTQDWARGLKVELENLQDTIERVRYLRLKREVLSLENPELNTDKKQLVSRFESLGFSPGLSIALEDADRELRAAATPLAFKKSMDLLRSVFEGTWKDAARTVESKAGKVAPTGPTFSPYNQYLRSVQLIDDHETALSQKLYNYVSNTGTHTLGSEREQARVVKNMVIELSLLVVCRVQAFVS